MCFCARHRTVLALSFESVYAPVGSGYLELALRMITFVLWLLCSAVRSEGAPFAQSCRLLEALRFLMLAHSLVGTPWVSVFNLGRFGCV